MAEALNIEAFKSSLETLFKNVVEATPRLTQEAALTAKAILVKRIREEGKNAEEISFPAYSEAYRKKKEAAGKYTGKTNLSYTNRMLNNLQITETGRDQLGYFADISAKNEDDKAKLEFNEERYHNILGLSAKEQNLLAKDYDDGIQEVINKSGFGK